MRPSVLLFDVDGTLVDTGGAGRRAIEASFDRCTGRRDACAKVNFAGMTDRAIVREGLVAIGRDPSLAQIDAIIAAYLDRLEAEVESSERYRVLASIELALAAVAARERCAVGLGTGNVERGARIKLKRGGLDDRFGFGGFGCDHEDRAALLRVGAQRGAARLGVSAHDCRVVVIGDTPRDIAAAKALGAECVAVATGHFSTEELAEHTPTHVFASLAEVGAIEVLLR